MDFVTLLPMVSVRALRIQRQRLRGAETQAILQYPLRSRGFCIKYDAKSSGLYKTLNSIRLSKIRRLIIIRLMREKEFLYFVRYAHDLAIKTKENFLGQTHFLF